MTRTLTVPLGPNAGIDGGPFTNFEARGVADPESDTVALYGEEDHGSYDVELADLEDALRDEMEDDQPILLRTGDVGDDHTVGTIRLPLLPGYTVEIHCLDGQGVDRVADLGNLADDHHRRRHFERKLEIHGGSIE